MKKLTPSILLTLLGLALLIFYLKRSQADLERTDGTAHSPSASASASGIEDTLPPKPPQDRETTAASGKAARSNKPPSPPFQIDPENFHSALVSAELKKGETLVMGGYRKADGSHEFILVTPKAVSIEGQENMIQLQTRTFSLNPNHLEQSGLDQLATDRRNADGQSEIWKLEERQGSLQNAGQLTTPPAVSVNSGEPATVSYGMQGGRPGFTIEYTATRTADGGFSIQALSERNPGGKH